MPFTDCETGFETLDKYENRYDAVTINGKVLHKSMSLKEFTN